jgi:membrane protease YdiL (CAAX protease family)
MLVGVGAVWSVLLISVGDPAKAGEITFRSGPLMWLVLQTVLLLMAIRGLPGDRIWDMVGFHRNVLPSDLPLGVGLALLSSIVVILITRLTFPSDTSAFYPWATVWWTLVGSLTAALGEEIYFRGFLMYRLEGAGTSWKILLTGLSFTLWHVNPLMFPHTFLLGLLYGWVYVKVGRLFPLILAHYITDVVRGLIMLYTSTVK